MAKIIDVILCIVIVIILIILIYNNFMGGNSSIKSVTPNNKKHIPHKKIPVNSNGYKKKKISFEDTVHFSPKKNMTIERKIKNPKSILKKKQKKSRDKVYMKISESGKYIGEIIIQLFANITPKTCKNFYYLCKDGKYEGCPFHRIIKDFMIQGGDYTKGNGTGGMSIYGEKFNDENFKIPHDRPYLLSMANSGPNTNGSQFFITTSETPHLDGKHVVFGEIISGQDVVNYLNNVETNSSDKPKDNVIISECGII